MCEAIDSTLPLIQLETVPYIDLQLRTKKLSDFIWTNLLGNRGGLGSVVKLDTLCLRLNSASLFTREAFFCLRSFLSDVKPSTNLFLRSNSPVSSWTLSSSSAILLSLSSRVFSRSLALFRVAWSPLEWPSSLLVLRFRFVNRLVIV